MGYRLNANMEKTLVDYVTKYSGFGPGRVIWDRQDVYGSAQAVQPNKPFMVLNINKIKTPHAASRSWFTLDTWNMAQIKAFTMEIRIISLSDGYLNILDEVRCALDRIEVRESFRAVDMAWWNASDVQDITVLYSTQHVYQAYFEAEFAFSANHTEETGQIDKVRVDYDYNNGDHIGTIIVPP